MKKTFVIFILCLVLALGGVAAAVLPIRDSQDQVTVSATTLEGDPRAAQGLTATAILQLNGQVTWSIAVPADDPQAAVTERSQSLGSPDPDSYAYSPQVNLSDDRDAAGFSSPSGSPLEDALNQSSPLVKVINPVYADVASRTPKGESRTETLNMADYLDHYSFSLWVDYPYDLQWEGQTMETYQGAEAIGQAIRDFFAIPLPEEDLWAVTVEKNQEGDILALQCKAAGFTPSLYPLTVFPQGACLFTFRDDLAFGLDFDQIPGGYGIYRMDRADTILALESLTNVFSLPEGSSVLTMDLAPDGKDLFLTYCLGEDYTLLILDPETMTVKQSFPIPARAPLTTQVFTLDYQGKSISRESFQWDVDAALYLENGFLVYGYETFHFFARNPDGSYALQFSCPRPVSVSGSPSNLFAAWNGEKLALASGTYTTYTDTGFTVTILDDAGAVLYRGLYENSLSDPVQESHNYNVESPNVPILAESDYLALAWE